MVSVSEAYARYQQANLAGQKSAVPVELRGNAQTGFTLTPQANPNSTLVVGGSLPSNIAPSAPNPIIRKGLPTTQGAKDIFMKAYQRLLKEGISNESARNLALQDLRNVGYEVPQSLDANKLIAQTQAGVDASTVRRSTNDNPAQQNLTDEQRFFSALHEAKAQGKTQEQAVQIAKQAIKPITDIRLAELLPDRAPVGSNYDITGVPAQKLFEAIDFRPSSIPTFPTPQAGSIQNPQAVNPSAPKPAVSDAPSSAPDNNSAPSTSAPDNNSAPSTSSTPYVNPSGSFGYEYLPSSPSTMLNAPQTTQTTQDKPKTPLESIIKGLFAEDMVDIPIVKEAQNFFTSPIGIAVIVFLIVVFVLFIGARK